MSYVLMAITLITTFRLWIEINLICGWICIWCFSLSTVIKFTVLSYKIDFFFSFCFTLIQMFVTELLYSAKTELNSFEKESGATMEISCQLNMRFCVKSNQILISNERYGMRSALKSKSMSECSLLLFAKS